MRQQHYLHLSLILLLPISIQHCASRIPETMTTTGYCSHLRSGAPSAVAKEEIQAVYHSFTSHF